MQTQELVFFYFEETKKDTKLFELFPEKNIEAQCILTKKLRDDVKTPPHVL